MKSGNGGSKNPRQPVCLITRDTNTARYTQVRKTCEMVATGREGSASALDDVVVAVDPQLLWHCVMTKSVMINNRTDSCKTDVNLFNVN